MNTASAIKQTISRYRRGEPFTNFRLLELGSRQAVDTALSRLVEQGNLCRIIPGVYMRPKFSKYVGEIAPDAHRVIELVAKERGEVIMPQGVEAARYFKLTTQVPLQTVYYTSGTSRTVTINQLKIRLKHVSPSKLVHANTKTGLAITALRYVGNEQVTFQTIEKIRQQLSTKEFTALLRARVPVWLKSKLNQYEAKGDV